jgi:hypothetical protein
MINPEEGVKFGFEFFDGGLNFFRSAMFLHGDTSVIAGCNAQDGVGIINPDGIVDADFYFSGHKLPDLTCKLNQFVKVKMI